MANEADKITELEDKRPAVLKRLHQQLIDMLNEEEKEDKRKAKLTEDAHLLNLPRYPSRGELTGPSSQVSTLPNASDIPDIKPNTVQEFRSQSSSLNVSMYMTPDSKVMNVKCNTPPKGSPFDANGGLTDSYKEMVDITIACSKKQWGENFVCNTSIIKDEKYRNAIEKYLTSQNVRFTPKNFNGELLHTMNKDHYKLDDSGFPKKAAATAAPEQEQNVESAPPKLGQGS